MNRDPNRLLIETPISTKLIFVFVLGLVTITAQPTVCLSKEIAVELVWNYGDDAWVQIEILEGNYTLIAGDEVLAMTQGDKLQVGATALAPIIRIKDSPFRYCQSKSFELRTDGEGVFQVLTPDQTRTSYRGNLNLNWDSSKLKWTLVNTLDEEDYLKGVVPIEMSNSWAARGFEALKAQAVAARTYMVKFASNGRITDSPNIHQAYLGKSVEGEASKAVAATQGEILVDTKSGRPIDVFYSSHNGGHSEETQNVWLNHDPHYTALPDPFSLGFGGAVANWTFVISAPRLGELFGLAPIRQIELDKFPSGRVKMVRMTDWRGQELEVKGRSFVQKLYPYDRPISAQSFLGSLFEVAYIPTSKEDKPVFRADRQLPFGKPLKLGDNTPPGPRWSKVISSYEGVQEQTQPYGVFVFNGRGWGHGVGMSQWGAYHMAQLGYTYRQILDFYYVNTRIAIRK